MKQLHTVSIEKHISCTAVKILQELSWIDLHA